MSVRYSGIQSSLKDHSRTKGTTNYDAEPGVSSTSVVGSHSSDEEYWDAFEANKSMYKSMGTRQTQPSRAVSSHINDPGMMRLKTAAIDRPGDDMSTPWASSPQDFREAQGKGSIKSVRFDRLMTRATPIIPTIKTFNSRRTRDVSKGITLDAYHSHHLILIKQKLASTRSRRDLKPHNTKAIDILGRTPGVFINSNECGRFSLPWEVVFDLYPASYNLGILN